MSYENKSILIIQTAFIGDAILTLPLIQSLKVNIPTATIDVVAIPRTKDIFEYHPAVSKVYAYNKHSLDKGMIEFIQLTRQLKTRKYDIAIVPHRSLRSALLAWISGIPERIGFDRSSGKKLLTSVVHYEPSLHEIDRNLVLLRPLGIIQQSGELPKLYPTDEDRSTINDFFTAQQIPQKEQCVAIAPGSIWLTKRWLPERFAHLAGELSKKFIVFLIGAESDRDLCEMIAGSNSRIINCAGEFTLLQSAELIRRCIFIVSNDSAPMHLSVSVGTPVIAIYGATVPEFGFAPRGPFDEIVQINGLSCRPCGIHGGNRCPIKTFDCMRTITVKDVLNKIEFLLQRVGKD